MDDFKFTLDLLGEEVDRLVVEHKGLINKVEALKVCITEQEDRLANQRATIKEFQKLDETLTSKLLLYVEKIEALEGVVEGLHGVLEKRDLALQHSNADVIAITHKYKTARQYGVERDVDLQEQYTIREALHKEAYDLGIQLNEIHELSRG